ncbi:MAG: HlyC/CorC family transporter [Anaerolineaceae bacterium]|nr:MAG: HlyC/CorC family transporter [Anaerolineaceae bacterium]
MSSWNEILIVALLILVNGILSMSEAALMASRKARLQQQANEGDHASQIALDLSKKPNTFLTTVQIGITLISVLTGAFGGATLAKFLAIEIAKVQVLELYSESLALGFVVLVITILTIWLGELVPKRLGLHRPELIARIVAKPMLFVSRLFSPLITVISWSTDLILRLLGINASEEQPVTEEELQVLLDQGTQAGVFEESEQDMIEGVFSIGDQRVYSLMTPRTEIVWLEVDDPAEEIRKKIAGCSFSRFPVRDGSLENVVGVVRSRDLLLTNLAGEKINLRHNLHPAIYIPESAMASQALEMFKGGKAELMLVVDEFGAVQGLITLNDILSEIVEGIGTDEPVATQRQDGSWLLDGMLSVDDFKEIFNLRDLPEEEDYETLGGFVMFSLGRIPQTSDQFEWSGLHFEVMDMDARRVDKVLVTTLKNKPASPPKEAG